MMELTVVDWNVNGFVRQSQAEFLESLSWDIACLQEVTRDTWSEFRNLAHDGSVAFDRLSPLAGSGPRYANAILVRPGFTLSSFSLLADMPSPERSATGPVSAKGQSWTVGSWSAPPGVSWGKAGKGRQVSRFAAWLRDRPAPTIIGIDRNAPKFERSNLADDEWWNDREPLMYGPDRVHDLRDVYRDHLERHPDELDEIARRRPDGPLATTHSRRGVACRYDAIYASPEFSVHAVEHLWDEAGKAGSDHALVRAVLSMRDSP